MFKFKVKLVKAVYFSYNVALNFFSRSEASGNCLYSSMSLALIGDNSLLDELRIMTSVYIFLNLNFYSKHPHFNYIFNKYKDKHVFNSVNNLFPMSASFESSENCCCLEEIVKNQAPLNFQDKRWCSFLCMLALSSVTSADIFSHYPDCDEESLAVLLV